MAGKLITFPLRVWLGSARLLTRAATGAAGRAASLAGQTIGVASSNGSSSDHGRRSASPSARAASATAETGWREERIPTRSVSAVRPLSVQTEPPPAAEPAQVFDEPAQVFDEPAHVSEQPAQVFDEPAHVSEQPAHVSEEPELVREVAEPGAEDGAGARVTVMEPWKGYAHMNAREVIARARQAGSAELAAVRLYESRHRSRQTVLAAVDRQLKLASGGSPA
jgi:hypothetical protein